MNFNLKIIEDAAHALESFSNIGKVGNNDNCTAFSFYANKNLTTGGEGGAVSTNDSNLAKKIKKLSLHGMTKDAWNRFSENGKWFYEVDELGYKYNLTDVAASIGLQQLPEIDSNNKKREKIAKSYDQFFDQIGARHHRIEPDRCERNRGPIIDVAEDIHARPSAPPREAEEDDHHHGGNRSADTNLDD